MEKAFQTGRIKDIERADSYDRLYYGVEFCEIKIPTADETKKAYKLASSNDSAFTFVTPYVTDRGLDAISRSLAALPADGTIEVVINDFGTLRLLKESYPGYVPVLGRLLVKQKRGFGISAFKTDVGQALAETWRATGVDHPAVRSYLASLGVGRVELDNLVQGFSSDFSKSGLAASLYTPYGYVTTTRYCPWAYDGATWPNLIGTCGRACLQGMIEETGAAFSQKLYISGNAQFYENEQLPEEAELLKKGIDRIVYQANVPV